MSKRKGTRNEHRSAELLRSAGYRVIRSAGSHGEWDLVGISGTDIVLVQVKTRDWPSQLEIEQLRSYPCPPNCRRLIHRWRDRQRFPDVREL